MLTFPRRLILSAFVLLASLAHSQAPENAKFFDDARQQIAEVRKQLAGDALDDAKLNALRDSVAALGTQADAIVADSTPRLAAVQARLDELGPAPAKATGEAPDIALQRADLVKQSAQLDAQIKRAKLFLVDAQQTTAQIAETRRATFQATLSQRTRSPLTPGFWKDARGGLERDAPRFSALRDGTVAALSDSFAADNRAFAFAGLGIGIGLLVFGRWWAEHRLLQMTADRVPQAALRRSAHAFAVVVVATLCSGIGAQIIVSGLNWHGALSESERALAQAIVNAVFFGSFVAGLGRALLASRRPSWRLPAISDETARRLRLFPLLFGWAIGLSYLLKQVNVLVNASLSATIAGSFAVALVYALLVGAGLLRARRRGARSDSDETPASKSKGSPWVGIGRAALWVAVIATIVAALSGYIALSHQIARQMIGLGIVIATFYLLVRLLEDLFVTIVCSRSAWAERTFAIEPGALDQLRVLGTGLIRVCAVLLAAMAALSPLGTGPSDLLARLADAGSGLTIGQIEIAPRALLGAVAVFVAGLIVLRMFKRWLMESYLPTTRMDLGMRLSVTTLLGYAGGVIVVALALSALGFGLEKITWVASALSVGIGFGLQAIVQNFVSGLILLVERPVKVGDWVVLGDIEGDIRRINVRATEIQMGDRSTVIVPNSDLITKSVRNVTLDNAEGRVRLRLPMPLSSDVKRIREHMLEAFAAHASVLKTPAPVVLIDGIEGTSLIFVGIAYVANPRTAGGVRSDLLFDLLTRLHVEQISLVTPYKVKLDAPLRAGDIDVDAAGEEQSG